MSRPDLEQFKHIIYCFTNTVNGKRYIGLTMQESVRRRAHEYAKGAKPLACAMRKYGRDKFIYEVLHRNLSRSAACELEKEAIQYYNSYDDGYNLTLGGEDNSGRVGEKAPRAKLTEKQSQYIIDSPMSARDMATELAVSRATICKIRSGDRWKHLDRSAAPPYEDGHHRVTTEQLAEQVIMDKCSNTEAVRKYNLSDGMVSMIRSGELYAHMDRSNAPEYPRHA